MKELYRILGFVVKAVMRYFSVFCTLSKILFFRGSVDLANEGINYLLLYVSIVGEGLTVCLVNCFPHKKYVWLIFSCAILLFCLVEPSSRKFRETFGNVDSHI